MKSNVYADKISGLFNSHDLDRAVSYFQDLIVSSPILNGMLVCALHTPTSQEAKKKTTFS